ncbi:hypothetical protein Dcar01_03357 [Deinococcus carri]|uniref:SD-repeat containing protein B domain-containing protein n=1 Tax=Deinococcus carri TaxID=1211323 RepID=A0ABP9WBT5_9DEIO
MRTLSLTLCLLGSVAAQQVTNTASLHLNGGSLPSNTVELQRAPTCTPSLSVDGAAGTEGLLLDTPGTVFVPHTLRQGGAGGEITLSADVLPQAAWTPRLAVFLDADRDGRPDGEALTRLTLGAGEERPLLLAVSAGTRQTGTVRVQLSAACGSRRADGTPVEIRPRAGATPLLLNHSSAMREAEVGQPIPFTLTLRNPVDVPLPATIEAVLPDDATYLPRAGDGAPEVRGNTLLWTLTLPPGVSQVVTYHVQVLRHRGPQVTSVAVAQGMIAGRLVRSERAAATVALRAGVFDQRGTLIGQVFVDQNGNGRSDAADVPVRGARVLLANGTQTLTDARGQYTFRNLDPGSWLVGLDPATLPASPADGALRRAVDVAGLARADFALAPVTATVARATPAAPTLPPPQGLIRSPLRGAVVRDGNRTGITLEGPASEPVSLRVNGREVPEDLLGERGPGQTPGSVRLGFVGVPLEEGVNTLEARFGDQTERLEVTVAGTARRLVFRPVSLVADGHSSLVVDIAALDARGTEGGNGFVTVSTDLEPTTPDAAPLESGYQVALRGGVARVTLAPLAAGREFTLRAALGSLTAETRLYAPSGGSTLALGQGSVGVQVAGGQFGVTGSARGYLETPLAGGQLRAAVDTGGLPGVEDFQRFPVTGSSTEAQTPLRSDDAFAVRYDRPDLTVGYYAAPLGVPGLETLPVGTALRVERRGPLRVQAFAGLVAGDSQVEEFTPGGSLYHLNFGPRTGSERVVVRSGGRDRVLVPGQEYVLDSAGTLVLAAPLGPYDADFLPVRLIVTYVPATARRNVLAAGVGAQYSRGPWTVEFGAAHLQRWSYSVGAAYDTPQFSVKAGYRQDPLNPEGRLTVDLRGQQGPFSVVANVSSTPSEGTLGTASATYRFGVRQATLRQRFESTGARTEAALEQRFGPVSLGLGFDYDWSSGTFGALGLARYEAGPGRVEVTHAQPLGGRAAETRVVAAYQLSSSLTAEAQVRQQWGVGATGELGLRQRVGTSNFNVTYQLPGVSGEASRARFGLDVPLTLSERWSANVGAGLERDMGSGTLGGTLTTGVRYQTPTFFATLGGEYGFTGSAGRLTLRGGAAGQLGEGQTLSVDASAQLLPTPQGRFTVSYALRRDTFALLTYHRVQGGTTRVLEGEVQANLRVRPALDLQPSLAYRLPLGDAAASSVQLGLGATVLLTKTFGVTASGYLLWQPAANTWSAAAGLDARYRLADPVWLVAGYTWSGFSGLTEGARPGFHVRLDFGGGTP